MCQLIKMIKLSNPTQFTQPTLFKMPRGVGVRKSFVQALELLVEFRDQHGHLNVPQSYTTQDGPGHRRGQGTPELDLYFQKILCQ